MTRTRSYESGVRLDHSRMREALKPYFRPKRTFTLAWSCSNFADHEHGSKWTAWLCGRWQYLRFRWQSFQTRHWRWFR